MDKFDIMSMVAGLMELSARTAPKALGLDCVKSKIVTGTKPGFLADAMDRYGIEKGAPNFDRDAASIRRSHALLLLSLDNPSAVGLNCGACGCKQCDDIKRYDGPEFNGPLCAWRLIDLGIALGSAAKTAGVLNADNRIMYRPGVVAKKIGLIEGDIVVGIPISSHGKNIYFDR